jgi:outer membrane protein assembly factor BamB
VADALAGTPAGTPAVADGTVFVTDDRRLVEAGDAFVRALDASSGAERWRTRVDDTAVFAPTVADGAVYVRTSTTLAALDAGDGSVRWTVGDRAAFDKPDYDLTMDMRPAVRDDTVYFPGPRAVVAVAAETGSIRWRTEATNVRSAPAVVDGTVYVPDVSAGVSAIDARTGDEQWSWEATGCWTSPAVADGRVYTTEGFDVVALDAADGAEVWRTGSDGLHGDSYSAPAVVGSTVVAGSINASVSALTAGDGGLFDSPGSVNWNMGAGTRTSPAVADGTVYAAAFSTRPRENALLALG